MQKGSMTMKLTQIWKNGEIRLAVETERGLLLPESSRTALQLIRGGKAAMEALKQELEACPAYTETVQYAPVVTGMDKILCVGLNYRSHIGECGEQEPEYPVLFSKFPNALGAHEEQVWLDPGYSEYDYEAELVIVLGKRIKLAGEEEAKAAIFGYTCGNDLSNRTTQLKRGGQWLVGKTMDGFGPIGPRVVTADELDPSDLRVMSRVNGETRQDARTSLMIFSVPRIVSYISQQMTLEPGDVIFTGTPAGVMLGYAQDEKQWLRPGDRVEVEIEGIGVLKTKMI